MLLSVNEKLSTECTRIYARKRKIMHRDSKGRFISKEESQSKKLITLDLLKMLKTNDYPYALKYIKDLEDDVDLYEKGLKELQKICKQ